jgi:hypothetical protein
MKNLLLFLLPLFSFSQIIIDQSVVESPPYKVGDVITIEYKVNTGNLDVNYLWLRYNYNNNALEMVPNSTVFSQGSQAQTSYIHWFNFIFNPNPNIGVGELLRQYNSSGWNYTTDTNWSVGQLAIQRTDASISGVIASQKYRIKDAKNFDDIHKLHLAYATTRNNVVVQTVGSNVLWLDLNNVSRLVSSVKFKVSFPANYDITKHNVQVMETDANGVINWASNPTPAFVGPLNSTGEVITDKLIKGKKYMAMVTPAFGQNVPDNIITVTDAYKAFKAITDRGLNNTNPFFPTNLENSIANVTQDQSFDSQDAYYLFATVMGIDLSSVQGLMLPTKDMTKSVKFLSGFTDTFLSEPKQAIINPTQDDEYYNLSYAWGGDLDFSHSSQIATTSSRISKSSESSTSITTSLKDGKVVVEVAFDNKELAGAEYKIGYDDSKLQLENILFDTGNTMTNFSTHKDNIITFGSMDKQGTQKIKIGTPYKLIFKTKTPLTNTSGLIFTYFAEAVDGNANKVNLKIK